MNAKYSDKVKELELVGQYVDRLGMIESNLSQDVDEGNIDRYVLTLLTNCIDRINRVYIEGENKYLNDNEEDVKDLKDKLAKCWCYGQELNEYDNGLPIGKVTNDCDEFGKVSDVVTKNDDGTQESEVV